MPLTRRNTCTRWSGPRWTGARWWCCDRYVDSMIAYQGAGRVLESAEVEQVARWATEDLRPDLTVLLDVDHLAAVSIKADKDRVEAAGDDFHARARQHLLDLAERDPAAYLVLDARATRDEPRRADPRADVACSLI